MCEIELPNGDVVEPGTVILYEEYPYRVDADEGIVLSPLYWGDSELDLTFESQEALAASWGEDSAGVLSESEWRDWLTEARHDDRFGDDELDAVADVVLPSRGLVDRFRDLFGLD